MNAKLNNVIFLSLDKLIPNIANFFVFISLADYLGPSLFGEYNLFYTIISIALICSSFGVNEIAIREFVKEKKACFSLLLLARLSTTLIVIICMVLVGLFSETNYPLVALLIPILLNPLELSQRYLEYKCDTRVILYSKVIFVIIFSALKLLFISLEMPFSYFLYLSAIEFLPAFLIAYIYTSKKYKLNFIIRDIEPSSFKRVFLLLLPMFINSLVVIVNTRVDQLMIFNLLDSESLGIYAVGSRLAEFWLLIPSTIFTIYFPVLMDKMNQKYWEEAFLLPFLSLINVFVLILASGVIIFSYFVINMYFSSNYHDSFYISMILNLSSIFIQMRVLTGKLLIAKNEYKRILTRSIIAIFINVFLNIIMIPQFGIYGAAFSSLISMIFLGLLYDFLDVKYRNVFWIKIRSFFVILNPLSIFKYYKIISKI